jgi:hypothetical protein
VYSVKGLNQYTAVAVTAQTYDANGNLAAEKTNTYACSVENLPASGASNIFVVAMSVRARVPQRALKRLNSLCG